MNEYLRRQVDLAFSRIHKYKNNQISLDSLVLDLESLTQLIGLGSSNEISDALSDLEVINSFLIEEKRNTTSDEDKEISKDIEVIESLLQKTLVNIQGDDGQEL